MTPAAALLSRLRERGVNVSLRPDGKLFLQPKIALTPDLLVEAKKHRDALAALLEAETTPLSPAECQVVGERLVHALEQQDRASERRWQAGAAGSATVVHLRPVSWADVHDEPQPGDRCSCCRGFRWWREREQPKGWRCHACHPPIPSIAVTESPTEQLKG